MACMFILGPPAVYNTSVPVKSTSLKVNQTW